jgi:hypothetical protein
MSRWRDNVRVAVRVAVARYLGRAYAPSSAHGGVDPQSPGSLSATARLPDSSLILSHPPQVGYDQLEAEERRLGGPAALPAAQPAPAVPNDTPEMSGHVDALQLPAARSKPATGHAEPSGKQEDDQPKGFARSKKAEMAELSESTIGMRGLNADVKVRSKIRRPAPQRALEMGTTSLVMPVLLSTEPEPNPNVMQLWMDRDRRAAAVAFGFSEGGPLQSHRREPATARPAVAVVVPTESPAPNSAKPAPLAELGRSLSPVRGKPAYAGSLPAPFPAPARIAAGCFAPAAVSVPPDNFSLVHHERALLSSMAQESVASAQRHAAPRGQPALSPALSPVLPGFAQAGSGLSPLKGSAKLTWDSLEEMSFEDLLTLDARATFTQLPPLPDRGTSHSAKRESEPARGGARSYASRPSGVERQPQQTERTGQRAGRAAPERGAPQPSPPPKKRDAHPPPAQVTLRRPAGQPPAQPPAAFTSTKRAPADRGEHLASAPTNSRRAATNKAPEPAQRQAEPAWQSERAPAVRSRNMQGIGRTEVAAQGSGRGDTGEPAAPHNPPKKTSRSAPVQRPVPPKKAPPPQREEEPPQQREAQERSRRGKPAPQQTAPVAFEPGPMMALPMGQPPLGFGHGYMMPSMNYGMLGSPFGPPPMMNPYQMMTLPPSGLAAHFMPMPGPASMYGVGPGLAQGSGLAPKTWMRGEEVQHQRLIRVGGRGRV